jgi:hypothetical protein
MCIPIKLFSREVLMSNNLNIINNLNKTGREHKECMITDFVAPRSSLGICNNMFRRCCELRHKLKKDDNDNCMLSKTIISYSFHLPRCWMEVPPLSFIFQVMHWLSRLLKK